MKKASGAKKNVKFISKEKIIDPVVISEFVNAWNHAAVLSSLENQKLPSERKEISFLVGRAQVAPSVKRRSTNDWNLMALERLAKD